MTIVYHMRVDFEDGVDVQSLLLQLSLRCVGLILKLVLLTEYSSDRRRLWQHEFRLKSLLFAGVIIFFLSLVCLLIGLLDILCVFFNIFAFQSIHPFDR